MLEPILLPPRSMIMYLVPELEERKDWVPGLPISLVVGRCWQYKEAASGSRQMVSCSVLIPA